MIYFTGDIHGDESIRKLGVKKFPEGRGLNRDDFVIICGDFGLVWCDPPSREEAWWLAWLEDRPWTTLFVDGNHENHDMLDAMEASEWMGGRVHRVRPHVIHLMRGEVFDLPDGGSTVRLLAFGGARSHDVRWRTDGLDWWPRELPNLDDFENACFNLDACGWEVDYVATHDCPSRLKSQVLDPSSLDLPSWHDEDRRRNDRLNVYLDEIDARLRYRAWYFGHYHRDRRAGERSACLYRQVVQAGGWPTW